MSLIPYHPFRGLDKFFGDDWSDLWEWPGKLLPQFSQIGLTRTPKVDIYEKDNNVIAEFELPGVSPENIDVEVKKDMLKVEVRSEEKRDEKEKGYFRQERNKYYYRRIVPFPVDVQEAKAAAEYEQGILKVVIPKAAPQKTEEKKIKVPVKTKGKTAK